MLGYLDVGTIEPGRSWVPRAKPYRLDYWRAWREWYADVDAPAYRLLLQGVAGSLLAKGFDGLLLDNVDMTETHPAQTAGMRALVVAIARLVHARHGYVFAQNGADVIGPLIPYLDGWNREDANRGAGALAELRRMRARGLLVLATDYAAAPDPAAVRAACRAGALPFVSNRELTRVPRTALRCQRPR